MSDEFGASVGDEAGWVAFLAFLEDNPVVLSKSKLPGVSQKKKEAIKLLVENYEKNGILMTEKQVLTRVLTRTITSRHVLKFP